MESKGRALLVVDMLNEFLKEGGKMPFDRGIKIIPHVKRLVERCRRAKIPVVYLNDNHRADKYDWEFQKRIPHCIENSWGAEVIEELTPQQGDYVIKKRRYSGFYGTDLDTVLRELGVRTLMVTGVVTNICVRSTIHDAFFRGYKVIVPKDCVEATDQREQDSSLYDIETHFGEITESEKLDL
ncbi:MAG: cysteine hydrolase [Nitrospira sp.]|nr:cysteine hydrolase [Nitrospira sp.]